MDEGICVVIPTIPPRAERLRRALRSVHSQQHKATAVAVAVDNERRGAGATRNKALEMATCEWVAFLDDDDEFLEHHLLRCWETAQETGADVIVPWYQVIGGSDPLPAHRGLQPNPNAMHQFGITCLVRREAIGDIRFVEDPWEDFHFWTALGQAGAAFHAIPDITWLWWHWGYNTSGRPEHW